MNWLPKKSLLFVLVVREFISYNSSLLYQDCCVDFNQLKEVVSRLLSGSTIFYLCELGRRYIKENLR
jgi:hypothetical protein